MVQKKKIRNLKLGGWGNVPVNQLFQMNGIELDGLWRFPTLHLFA